MVEHQIVLSTIMFKNVKLSNENLSSNPRNTTSPSTPIYIYLARTPEIGQGLGRILSCAARKPEQT